MLCYPQSIKSRSLCNYAYSADEPAASFLCFARKVFQSNNRTILSAIVGGTGNVVAVKARSLVIITCDSMRFIGSKRSTLGVSQLLGVAWDNVKIIFQVLE